MSHIVIQTDKWARNAGVTHLPQKDDVITVTGDSKRYKVKEVEFRFDLTSHDDLRQSQIIVRAG